jgi:uncharacterized protein YbcI
VRGLPSTGDASHRLFNADMKARGVLTIQRENLRKRVMEKRCRTIRELEAEISQAVIRFEKELMGRGPLETKTYLIDDVVLIRLKGVLTPSEMKLAETDGQRGRYLLKQVRQELIDHGRPMLEALIREVLGIDIRSLHTDISTKSGERIIVLTLASKPPLGSPEHTPLEGRSEVANGRH